MVEDKPQWVYDKLWDDSKGPIKDLRGNNFGRYWTMEVLFYPTDNTKYNTIFSSKRNGAGIELVGPYENNK